MTRIDFAWASTSAGIFERCAERGPVNLLVSVFEFPAFMRWRDRYNIGHVFMDSGAFSVASGARELSNEDFIAMAKDYAPCYDEVAGLDVIGDADATRSNIEAAWEAGVDVIPTVHPPFVPGAFEWVKDCPKVAMGGVAGMGLARPHMAGQFFANVWPKKVHGFGCTLRSIIGAAPFHSVDASSWAFAPCAMRNFVGYTGKQTPVPASRGIIRDGNCLWNEIREYQKRGEWAAYRWRRQLAQLEGMAA